MNNPGRGPDEGDEHRNEMSWKVASPLRHEVRSKRGEPGPPDVKIDIETNPQRLADAVAEVEAVATEMISSYGRQIIAKVPVNEVKRLARSDSIRRMDVYEEPRELATSGGVDASNADLLHDIGLTGEGVTIAVIDTKFNEENDDYEDNVVGTIGDGIFKEDDDDFETGFHGTNTAEIVHDMAPDADLILASLNGESLGSILDALEDHDSNPWDRVDVATHSIGYGMNKRLDGEDSASKRIKSFTDDGRLFTTAAGNEASGNHWDGEFKDTSGNDLMEFDASGTERFEVEKNWDEDDEDPEDVSGVIDVHWDLDWDSAGGEYKVKLYDEETGGTELDSSKTDTPHERVRVSGDPSEKVYLEIENIDGSGDEHFDIFTSSNGPLNFPTSTPERSLVRPATSRYEDTITVAAVDVDREYLAGYSSQGPTQDGRRGIDIAGSTHVDLDEASSFGGTSAATPHIGGAAGLLFDSSIGASEDEIREAQYDGARDTRHPSASDPGPNNTKIGFGYLDVRVARDILEEIMITLDEKWTYDISNRVQFSTPDVASRNVYAGSLGRDLVALDEADGSETWSKPRDGALSDSSPHISDGTVYVGSGGGVLYALTLDGTRRWSYELDSAITASPVVDDNTVFVGANDSTVHAVRASDGGKKWETDVPDAVYSDVAASNGKVFVTTRNGLVVALDAGTGSEVWRHDTGTQLELGSPTATATTVYVAGSRDVFALDHGTGGVVWQTEYGGSVGSSPAVDTANNEVYVGSQDGLYAFDASYGDRLWDTEIGTGFNEPVVSSPALAEERVIAASLDGELALIDSFIEPGTIIERRDLASETMSSPSVSDNDVYIGSEEGTIFALKGE